MTAPTAHQRQVLTTLRSGVALDASRIEYLLYGNADNVWLVRSEAAGDEEKLLPATFRALARQGWIEMTVRYGPWEHWTIADAGREALT